MSTVDISYVGVDSATSRRLDASLRRALTEHLTTRPGDRVLLKPNLTLPWYQPGACTSKVVLECLCGLLRDSGCRVAICEGDGGVAAYPASEAFAGNDLLDLSRRFGVEFVSLSLLPRKRVTQVVEGTEVPFDLPAILVERDFDRFISVPVLKVHVLTLLSLSMKNLWGCIPDPLRIHYHHVLDKGIVALWMTIRPDLSVIDGLIAMDGNGPMNGVPVPLGLSILGSGDATIDRVGATVLGIAFDRVKHLVIAEKEGLIQPWESLSLNQPIEPLCGRVFAPQRRLGNWGMIAMSHVPPLQTIVYHSPASKFVYRILRRIRRNNVQNQIRHYGDAGWGAGCGPSDFHASLGTLR